MNFFNEFALLFAVATPLVVLFAMNVFLMLEGERGTLMLPTADWASPEGVAGEEPARGAVPPTTSISGAPRRTAARPLLARGTAPPDGRTLVSGLFSYAGVVTH